MTSLLVTQPIISPVAQLTGPTHTAHLCCWRVEELLFPLCCKGEEREEAGGKVLF